MHDQQGRASSRASDDDRDDGKQVPCVVGYDDIGSRDLIPDCPPAADGERPRRLADIASGDNGVRRSVQSGQATGEDTALQSAFPEKGARRVDEFLHPTGVGPDEARDE
jgi:hypothetical protein